MTSTHNLRGLALGTAVTSALVAAAVAEAPSASASTDHAVPHLTTHQQHQATAAASTSGARELLATATRGAAKRAHTAMRAQAAKSAHVASKGTPVFALSAAFVRGDSDTAGRLWYVATPASTSAGPMTVFTARNASGHWRAVNVATGNTEARMAAAAHGASLLVEPQVNAWYAVSHDRVRPLNDAARGVVGKAPVTVSAYQHIVHARYADKQANSDYARRGTAGGFSASATTPGEATQRGPGGTQLGLAAGGVLAAGAVGFRLKRRRQH